MPTFKHYLIEQGLSSGTVTHYHRHALEFVTWLDGQNVELDNTSVTDITAYLGYLKNKGLVNFTRSLHLNVIKHFFNYRIHHSYIQSNPAAHIKIRGTKHKKLYPQLSKEELEQLYHNYEIPQHDDAKAKRNWFAAYMLSRQRNKTMIGLMIWQGLTTAEVSRLKPEDINLREGTIYVAGSLKSAERTLELKPQQILSLMEYQLITRKQLLTYYKNDPGCFYLSSPASGKKTAAGKDSTMQVWKRLTEEVKEINPRFINFKQVRTSVITHWLGQHNLRLVQYMAGHKYVSTTEAYQSGQVDDLQTDIEQFHPIG